MAKNAYLIKLQAQKAAELRKHRLFATQFCADAAVLAANEVFKRKGEIIVEFYNAFCKYANEIAEMTMEDAQGDRQIEYTKAKLDARLESILGDAFAPWDVRYGDIVEGKR